MPDGWRGMQMGVNVPTEIVGGTCRYNLIWQFSLHSEFNCNFWTRRIVFSKFCVFCQPVIVCDFYFCNYCTISLTISSELFFLFLLLITTIYQNSITSYKQIIFQLNSLLIFVVAVVNVSDDVSHLNFHFSRNGCGFRFFACFELSRSLCFFCLSDIEI